VWGSPAKTGGAPPPPLQGGYLVEVMLDKKLLPEALSVLDRQDERFYHLRLNKVSVELI
jgi:hypothetical protein